MEKEEGEISGLQHVINVIKEKGLPSKEEMRAVIEETESQRIRAEITEKLSEYGILFNKFKNGSATDVEISRMTALSVELETIRKKLGPEKS